MSHRPERRLSARYERTFMAQCALHVQIIWQTNVAHLPTEDIRLRPPA